MSVRPPTIHPLSSPEKSPLRSTGPATKADRRARRHRGDVRTSDPGSNAIGECAIGRRRLVLPSRPAIDGQAWRDYRNAPARPPHLQRARFLFTWLSASATLQVPPPTAVYVAFTPTPVPLHKKLVVAPTQPPRRRAGRHAESYRSCTPTAQVAHAPVRPPPWRRLFAPALGLLASRNRRLICNGRHNAFIR